MNKQWLVCSVFVAVLAGCGGEEPDTGSSSSSSSSSGAGSSSSSSSSSGGVVNGHHVTPELQNTGGKRVEKLDRGLVAVKVNNGVYLSWRLFGTDPTDAAFNLYRNGTLINGTPITGATNYTDNGGSNGAQYEVRAVIDGKELAGDGAVSVWGQQYLTVNLDRPNGGTSEDGVNYSYAPNDASVGDLDGDGQYELVIKWYPSNAKDNSQSGFTGPLYLDAYELTGQRLWRINFGKNIRAGAHYMHFMVYDFDGDGKAEVAARTSDGTIDAAGTMIGSGSADYRDGSGYIHSGNEFLTMFNGQTGVAIHTIDYPNTRGNTRDWGDAYGGRSERYLNGVAYLDGTNPSLIVARGYYGPQSAHPRHQTKITAVDFSGGRMRQRWQFHADSQTGQNREYLVQGAHSLSVADVDADGRDEIIYGAATIDDNGTGLYSTGLCHGDALHVADMDPNREGLEVYMVHEDQGCYREHGSEMHDARTGEILNTTAAGSGDVGRGVAGDILPDVFGMEMWGTHGNMLLANGQQRSAKPSQKNFMIWWDGDLSREILDGRTDNSRDSKAYIAKWNPSSNSTTTLVNGDNYNARSNNGTKATPSLSADLFGDWREEVIWRHSNNSQVMIFTTTIPTNERIHTLMHDPQYRVAIAWQNTAYNQPPHPSFYLGTGMGPAPRPNVFLTGEDVGSPTEEILNIQENEPGYCASVPVESDNGGYTGAGYANTENAAGVTVDWAVNVPVSDKYALTVRYASVSDRPARLLVNGATAVNSVPFSSTGAWSSWQTEIIEADLSAGNNTISLQATGGEGLGNIDQMQVWHTGAEPGNCP